jgi:glyoxylase-like metal-dependent hydrolase (beta-lactamase superfamily II)
MFTGGIGRTDIPHGSNTCMKESLNILLDLPDDTLIWPGHVYGSKYPVTLKENRRAVAWSMNSL